VALRHDHPPTHFTIPIQTFCQSGSDKASAIA